MTSQGSMDGNNFPLEEAKPNRASMRKSPRRKSLISRKIKSPIRFVDKTKEKNIKKNNIKRTRWGNQYGSGFVDGYDLRSSPMGNFYDR